MKRLLRDTDDVYRIVRDMRPWLWRFELLTRRPRIDPVSHADTWCHYLIALIECGYWHWFDWVWQRYLKKGGDLRHLARYFKLSEVAVARGCKDDCIVKSASVWNSLQAVHSQNPLCRMASGKSVALVGNGPQEIGKNSGAEIDAHDVVIRINNYDIVGRESDYGRRTDVWVKNATPEMRHVLPDPNIKMVVYSDDWSRLKLENDSLAHIENDLKDERIEVDYCDRLERAWLTDAIDSYPSAGAAIIAKLLKCPVKVLDVYGFSLLEANGEALPYVRLPKDVPAERLAKEVSFHNFPREIVFLRQHFNGRKLSVEQQD